MRLSHKNRKNSDAPRRQPSRSSARGESLDEIGLTEAVCAASAAVTALADTLNALVLRIALANGGHGSVENAYPSYYNRLALLAESASGQVRGIQKLLRAIELTTLRSEPEQINREHDPRC
jgi:hypothetical protein